ncbi:hypothetical protein ABPG72_006739, partial [Tetrahymena utriculariae]
MEEQKEQNCQRTILLNDQNDQIKIYQQALVRIDQQNFQNNTANNNNNNFDIKFKNEQLFKHMPILIAGTAVALFAPAIVQNCVAIACIGSVAYLIYDKQINNQQQRVQTLQDWEKLFGLDSFQELNDEPYTQQGLDAVFKQMNIFWNPNKKIQNKKNKQLSNVY